MRLHILGIARNASTPTLTMDPYAMISYYTATYLHRAGHEVHYYGYKESTVECTKKWECGNKEFLENFTGLGDETLLEPLTNWNDPEEENLSKRHIYPFEDANLTIFFNLQTNKLFYLYKNNLNETHLHILYFTVYIHDNNFMRISI